MGISSGCTNASDAGVMNSILVGGNDTSALTSFHVANNQTAVTQGQRDWIARQSGGTSNVSQGLENYNSRSAGTVLQFVTSWTVAPTDTGKPLVVIPRVSNANPGFHQWASPRPRYPVIININDIISVETSDATARPYTITMNVAADETEKIMTTSIPIRSKRARTPGYMAFYGQNMQQIGTLTGRPVGGTQFFSVHTRVDPSAWQDTQAQWNLNL